MSKKCWYRGQTRYKNVYKEADEVYRQVMCDSAHKHLNMRNVVTRLGAAVPEVVTSQEHSAIVGESFR